MYEGLYAPLPDGQAYARRIGLPWPLTPDLDTPELEADIYLFRYQEEDGQGTVEEIAEDEEFALAADALQQVQMERNP